MYDDDKDIFGKDWDWDQQNEYHPMDIDTYDGDHYSFSTRREAMDYLQKQTGDDYQTIENRLKYGDLPSIRNDDEDDEFELDEHQNTDDDVSIVSIISLIHKLFTQKY